MSTPFELPARERKARRIADVFRGHNASADLVRVLDPAGWVAAAALAGVPMPSSETQAQVIALLAEREAAA